MTDIDPAIDPEIKDHSETQMQENMEELNNNTVDNNNAVDTVTDNVNITEGEEEVFGVVDPTAIISAVPIVGKRGRKSKARNDGSDSDEAFILKMKTLMMKTITNLKKMNMMTKVRWWIRRRLRWRWWWRGIW